MTIPNFLIVGAPKCGTTAMWRYLSAHPEIYLSPKKDMHYFGKDYAPLSAVSSLSKSTFPISKIPMSGLWAKPPVAGICTLDMRRKEIYDFNPEIERSS